MWNCNAHLQNVSCCSRSTCPELGCETKMSGRRSKLLCRFSPGKTPEQHLVPHHDKNNRIHVINLIFISDTTSKGAMLDMSPDYLSACQSRREPLNMHHTPLRLLILQRYCYNDQTYHLHRSNCGRTRLQVTEIAHETRQKHPKSLPERPPFYNYYCPRAAAVAVTMGPSSRCESPFRLYPSHKP